MVSGEIQSQWKRVCLLIVEVGIDKKKKILKHTIIEKVFYFVVVNYVLMYF